MVFRRFSCVVLRSLAIFCASSATDIATCEERATCQKYAFSPGKTRIFEGSRARHLDDNRPESREAPHRKATNFEQEHWRKRTRKSTKIRTKIDRKSTHSGDPLTDPQNAPKRTPKRPPRRPKSGSGRALGPSVTLPRRPEGRSGHLDLPRRGSQGDSARSKRPSHATKADPSRSGPPRHFGERQCSSSNLLF